MISSKHVSASQRSKSLLDLFPLLGILLRNSVVPALEVVSLAYSFSSFCFFFFRFKNVLRTARIFWFTSSVYIIQYSLILHILSIKYFEESFRAFFALQLSCNVSTKFKKRTVFVVKENSGLHKKNY